MLTKKSAELLDGITLQPHQERFREKLKHTDALLALHGLGSGKTLTSIASTLSNNTDVVVPAALRTNYQKELGKFTKDFGNYNVQSYEGATNDGLVHTDNPNNALVLDEVQRIGNSGSKRSQVLRALASKYKKRIILSGTPALNHPSELAPVLHMLAPDTKDIPLSPTEFNSKFLKSKKVTPSFFAKLLGMQPGETVSATNLKDIQKVIKGKVHYLPDSKVGFPEKSEQLHHVEMSPEQAKIYRTVTSQANPLLAAKVRSNFPLSKREASQLNAFMTAARQVSNTAKPYGGKEELSPKMKLLIDNIEKAKDSKHVVYSNYLDAGINPIKLELERKGMNPVVFTGGLSDKARKAAVEGYNTGKNKVLLLSSSGAEGIDLKGTGAMHILEPHWHRNRIEQVIGRGIRFGSHAHLPEDQRKVLVHKYHSTLPRSILQKLTRQKAGTSADTYLDDLSESKAEVLEEFIKVLREEGLSGR